jgi:hypothetical protein
MTKALSERLLKIQQAIEDQHRARRLFTCNYLERVKPEIRSRLCFGKSGRCLSSANSVEKLDDGLAVSPKSDFLLVWVAGIHRRQRCHPRCHPDMIPNASHFALLDGRLWRERAELYLSIH